MTNKQMEQFEREKKFHAKRNIERARAKGEQIEMPEAIRSAGMVMGKTDEERKAWFSRMRKESGVE